LELVGEILRMYPTGELGSCEPEILRGCFMKLMTWLRWRRMSSCKVPMTSEGLRPQYGKLHKEGIKTT